MRRGGTTLLELLVVTVVFLLILTVVLGFYVWGHNTTESQSRIADNDRRMMQMVDRLRTLLVSGEIDRVISTEIDFTPIDTSGLDRRVANISSNAGIHRGASRLRESSRLGRLRRLAHPGTHRDHPRAAAVRNPHVQL